MRSYIRWPSSHNSLRRSAMIVLCKSATSWAVSAGSPTLARSPFRMATAAWPPCTSARMSCASSQRATGSGSLSDLYFVWAQRLVPSAARSAVASTFVRGSGTPAVRMSRDAGSMV